MSLPENSEPNWPSGGTPPPAWMDARVEAYVDDALPPRERAAFEQRLQSGPHWQAAVRRARQIRASLRARPQPNCPPEVTQTVFREARLSAPPRPTDRPAARPRRRVSSPPRAWQPPLAFALLLLMAAAAALWGQPAPTHEAPPFTHAEVQRATAEAEWTLAFLAHVTRETSTTVRDDVLDDRVAAPTRRAALRAFRHVPAEPHFSPTPPRQHTDR